MNTPSRYLELQTKLVTGQPPETILEIKPSAGFNHDSFEHLVESIDSPSPELISALWAERQRIIELARQPGDQTIYLAYADGRLFSLAINDDLSLTASFKD